MGEPDDESVEERAARKARERTEIASEIEDDRKRQARKARLLEEATRYVDAELETQIEFEAQDLGAAMPDYRERRLAELAAFRDERIHARWSELLLTEE